MSKKEIQAAMREAQLEAKNAETAEVREAAVKRFEDLKREFETADAQERCKAMPKTEAEVREGFRRELQDIRNSGVQREISLGTLQGFTNASIANAAEAQVVMVENPLPLVEPKSIYKKLGMRIQGNVPTDKIIWPYAKNAVELEERDEAEAAKEDVINWDNFKPTPYGASLTIVLDNEAIDNCSFDIFGYAVDQLGLAKGRYLDKKTISPAAFKGMKSPLSGKCANIETINATWKTIKLKTAGVSGKNVDMSGFCYFGNAMATAILETTPKANGQGGFILENGKIGAYPYYETEYACYKSTGAGTQQNPYVYSFDSENAYFGFGPFSLLAAVGHGVERMVVDPVTLAHKNQTRIIFHTKNSLTDLCTVDGDNYCAFQIYKLADVSDLPVQATIANEITVKQVKGTVTTKQEAEAGA